jgi:hypothetical protein
MLPADFRLLHCWLPAKLAIRDFTSSATLGDGAILRMEVGSDSGANVAIYVHRKQICSLITLINGFTQ